MASQARELLLQGEAKPEPQNLCRGPHGEVPWGPTQDTPGCCDAPGLRPWEEKVDLAEFYSLSSPGEGCRSPQTCLHPPKSPSPPEKKRGTENEIKA